MQTETALVCCEGSVSLLTSLHVLTESITRKSVEWKYTGSQFRLRVRLLRAPSYNEQILEMSTSDWHWCFKKVRLQCVSLTSTFLPTAREGNGFADICQSFCPQSASWLLGHCYGVLDTNPTGTLSCYRPQQSCGQGNIFTPVCHSVHRGGLPQCMLGYPPGSRPPGIRHPPGSDTPPGSRLQHTVYERPGRILLECFLVTGHNKVVAKVIFLHLFVILFTGGVCLSACWDTPPGADPPGSRPPGIRHPPGKQTPAYGLRAAGTHPTWMHSCYESNYLL